MQIQAIQNYGLNSQLRLKNNKNLAIQQAPIQQQVAFGNNEHSEMNGSKGMRNLIYGLMLLGATAGGGSLTSCDDGYAYAEAIVEATGGAVDTTVVDSCQCPVDSIIKWRDNFRRPWPLDTLFNNMKNWEIEGADGYRCRPEANRNIIHYEGTREWEYNSKEIGDINLTETNDPRILIYDTEIKDYKGNHESYGKRVLRIPTGKFYVTKKDGEVLTSPSGCFVEEYEKPFDEKDATLIDCTLKTRAFVQTNGDTLNVARIGDSNTFVETGKVAKGYLGANSILLQNLIGRYSTDDHYVDFKVDAINDEELRNKYIEDMKAKYGDGDGDGDGNGCID